MMSKDRELMTRREALAAIVISVVAACTSDRPTDENGDGDVIVEMTDALVFSPSTVNISVGDTVTFRNTSTFTHSATCDPAQAVNPSNVSLPASAQAWNSGILTGGGQFSHTFTVAGQYRYFCIPHELQNMLGTINVT